jgi:hypothetical protein
MTTIPIHGGREIGPPLLYRILEQLGIDEEELRRLRSDFGRTSGAITLATLYISNIRK